MAPSPQPTSARVFRLGPVRLELECVETFRGKLLDVGAGVDATGVMLWPGSLVLCQQLLLSLSRHHTAAAPAGGLDLSLFTHIVELGAGATGMAGLVAARLLPDAARATLTERDEPSLALLRGNAARVNNADGASSSSRTSDRVAVRALCWGDEAQADVIVTERGAASLCLGADILYPAIDVATITSMLRSARRLLQQPTGRLLLRQEGKFREQSGRWAV